MIPKFALLAFVFILCICFVTADRFRLGKLFRTRKFHLSESNGVNNNNNDVKTFWFNQTLDHFKAVDTRTWKQRYFINDTFYKPGGPVFLMIGGEGEDNPLWMSQGAWITYAEKLNAFCFSLEHRFYGQSHPTPDLDVKSLAYLSSEQALADLAQFTQAMNAAYNFTEGTKWIAFGGSYPGSLAAWYRLKYPHLVHASVSTSAPLEAKLNFKEYLGVVRDSIKRTNPDCLGQIQEASKSMEGLLRRRTGWQILQKTFKLCDDFRGDNSKDVSNFFESVAGNFEGIVQYNEDNRAFEGSNTANITIKTLCDIMTSSDEASPMQKYAQVNQLMLNISDQNCTDIKYSKLVKNMQQKAWNSSVSTGERQWTYQTCTEFGFYQSSDLEDQPFGNEFGINFSVRQCRDVYGSRFNQDFIEKTIKWSNTNYGGKSIKVSRVIFVNGSIDPWHSLGIISQNETSSDNVVIFIDGTAHCANMYPDSPKDLPQLTQARLQILAQLTEWLK